MRVRIQVLYLHANSLEKLTDLAPLSRLKNLSKLTLHGNAVENTPHYRSFVLLLVSSCAHTYIEALFSLSRSLCFNMF